MKSNSMVAVVLFMMGANLVACGGAVNNFSPVDASLVSEEGGKSDSNLGSSIGGSTSGSGTVNPPAANPPPQENPPTLPPVQLFCGSALKLETPNNPFFSSSGSPYLFGMVNENGEKLSCALKASNKAAAEQLERLGSRKLLLCFGGPAPVDRGQYIECQVDTVVSIKDYNPGPAQTP